MPSFTLMPLTETQRQTLLGWFCLCIGSQHGLVKLGALLLLFACALSIDSGSTDLHLFVCMIHIGSGRLCHKRYRLQSGRAVHALGVRCQSAIQKIPKGM
jgi:hypothetical protein